MLTPEGRVRVLDDSRRRDTRPEPFERRRFGREEAGRPDPTPSERRYREPEARRDAPAPGTGQPERQESGRGDDGGPSPNY